MLRCSHQPCGYGGADLRAFCDAGQLPPNEEIEDRNNSVHAAETIIIIVFYYLL